MTYNPNFDVPCLYVCQSDVQDNPEFADSGGKRGDFHIAEMRLTHKASL
jgi:hypothetical protein